MNTYLRDTLSVLSRDKELSHMKAVICSNQPTTEFDLDKQSWKEVRDVVKAARPASAPGASGVPYGVYKQYPSLLQLHWKIRLLIWRRGRVTGQ